MPTTVKNGKKYVHSEITAAQKKALKKSDIELYNTIFKTK